MNTNSVAPAAVCGTQIQSNPSFDCLTFLVQGDQIVLVQWHINFMDYCAFLYLCTAG